MKEGEEMKKVLKNEKGITLIALVITIIILLILASVSIAMLTGENGVLTQAIKAKSETQMANNEEQKKLDEVNEELESIGLENINVIFPSKKTYKLGEDLDTTRTKGYSYV